MKTGSLLRRVRNGKQLGQATEAGVGTARRLAAVVEEGACGWQRQLLPRRGEEGLSRGTCSTPMHLQPPARQATGSIMNEA